MKAVQSRARLTLKNILFCTDFSSDADIALPYAAELARHFGAKLFGFHVRLAEHYTFVPESGPLPPVLTDEEMRDNIKAMLDRFPSLERDAILGKGEVWPALASVIEDKEIDLVVVGTSGRTGFAKFLLGSEAEEIFRQASCPVMTVGPQLAKHLPRGGEISEILYASDLSPESMAAAPYAISLAQEYQAHLTLLHVITPQRTGDLVAPHELMASSKRLLRNMVPAEAELWCEPEYLIEQGDPTTKILETARHKSADLIVLGVRGVANLAAATHLPGATAHKVVTQAVCPVLTVRG
jgi:nucleotide-binding universal stress UspA family protein